MTSFIINIKETFWIMKINKIADLELFCLELSIIPIFRSLFEIDLLFLDLLPSKACCYSET